MPKPVVALLRSPVRYDAVLKSLELVQDGVVEKLAVSSRIVVKPGGFSARVVGGEMAHAQSVLSKVGRSSG